MLEQVKDQTDPHHLLPHKDVLSGTQIPWIQYGSIYSDVSAFRDSKWEKKGGLSAEWQV